MFDLIWVGNTLYPRWFVFMIVFVILFALASAALALVAWMMK